MRTLDLPKAGAGVIPSCERACPGNTQELAVVVPDWNGGMS